MYDEISTVKKEKDLAKKRAYVRMVTNLGGSLNLELFCEKVRSLTLVRWLGSKRTVPLVLKLYHNISSLPFVWMIDRLPRRVIIS